MTPRMNRRALAQFGLGSLVTLALPATTAAQAPAHPMPDALDLYLRGSLTIKDTAMPDRITAASIVLEADPFTGTAEIVIHQMERPGHREIRAPLPPDFLAALYVEYFEPTQRIVAMAHAEFRYPDVTLGEPCTAEEIAQVEAEGWHAHYHPDFHDGYDLSEKFAPYRTLIGSLGDYFLATLEPIAP